MGIEGRFQEYSESYLSGKEHRTMPLVPIHNIKKTPIAVMYGDSDRVCPYDTVEFMMQELGSLVYANYHFQGYHHADFGRANNSTFMDELLVALAHLDPHSGIMTEGGQFFDGANDTDFIQDNND